MTPMDAGYAPPIGLPTGVLAVLIIFAVAFTVTAVVLIIRATHPKVPTALFDWPTQSGQTPWPPQ